MATDPDLDSQTKMTLTDMRISLIDLQDALREFRADTRGDLRGLRDEIRAVGAKLDRLLFLLLAGLVAIVVALLTRKLG